MAGTRVVAFSERLGLAATLDEFAERADPYRSRTPGPQRSCASAEAWVASGRWEAGGEGPRSLFRTVCQVVAPTDSSPCSSAAARCVSASASRRRRHRSLDRCPKAEAIHGVNHLLDGNLRGVERDRRFFRSKTHIRSTHTLQPFQGLLDRDGSAPSRHPLDCQDHGGGVGERGVSEHDCQHYGHPGGDTLSHFMSSILYPEALP